MTGRILTYTAAAFLLVMASAGCEQTDIYYEVDSNVTLNAENTYYAGDPVVFNIAGNPDNLVFYSGEPGHEYKYKDYYDVPVEDVLSMTLDLEIQHRAGNHGVDTQNGPGLEIWYTDKFEGLNGSDAPADRAMVKGWTEEQMLADGWKKFPYEDPGRQQDVFVKCSADVLSCVTNFCLAFHWMPDLEGENTLIDTYWINGSLTVVINGLNGPETMTYDLKNMMGTTVMFDETISAYLVNSGNGSIRLDTNQDLTFAGGYYLDNPGTEAENDGIDHRCEGWIFSTPRPFNSRNADTGVVVKNLQNAVDSYSYTYENPGTYQATFVSTNYNYLGASEEVKHIQVTILDRPIE